MSDKILQIVPAQPGWLVYYHDGENTDVSTPVPVAMWALLEAPDGTTYVSGVAPSLLSGNRRLRGFPREWDGRPCSDTGRVSYYKLNDGGE
jgi:hypothetical protein